MAALQDPTCASALSAALQPLMAQVHPCSSSHLPGLTRHPAVREKRQASALSIPQLHSLLRRKAARKYAIWGDESSFSVLPYVCPVALGHTHGGSSWRSCG